LFFYVIILLQWLEFISEINLQRHLEPYPGENFAITFFYFCWEEIDSIWVCKRGIWKKKLL